MPFKELNKRNIITQNKRLHKAFTLFGKLLTELSKKELPDDIIAAINTGIDEINDCPESIAELKKRIRKNAGRPYSITRERTQNGCKKSLP